MEYHGRYGKVQQNGAYCPPSNVQGTSGRYVNVQQPIQKQPVKQTGSNKNVGRYAKEDSAKADKKDKVIVLRDIELDTGIAVLESTLNTLHLLNNIDKLMNSTVTYNEIYGLVGTREEIVEELALVKTHIDQMRIVDSPIFKGEISKFTDYVVSQLINVLFKNVRFKDVVKNINVLLTLNNGDDVIWTKLHNSIDAVIYNMTEHTLAVEIPLVITDDKTWVSSITHTLQTEVEYDTPLYDGMFYILIDNKVLKAIGNYVNIIKG